MRLVYLNADPGVPLLGMKGASIHVREMMSALARRADAFAAVTWRLQPRSPNVNGRGWTAETLPFPVHVVSSRVPPPVPGSPPRDAGAEALEANDAVEEVLEALYARGDLDALYERYSLWSVAGAVVAGRHRIPRVLEVNAPLVLEATRHRSLTMRSLATFVEDSLIAGADRIVAVSAAIRDHVIERGADPSRVIVLPNAVSVDHLEAGAAWRRRERPDGRFTIIFVGSLKPWHGLDSLADAFARLHGADPAMHLVLVGDGPMAQATRDRLASTVPASALTFTGTVPHHEVPRYLAAADVAVAPYPAMQDFYFSPLKLFEYCAAGLPVVASRVGQIEELMTDGENALLVAPGDVDELVLAIQRLRSDDALRRRLGSGARSLVRDRSWDSAAARVLELLPRHAEARP